MLRLQRLAGNRARRCWPRTAAGGAELNPTGTLRIKVVKADGTEVFEPFNLEHRIRLSDNPWMAKGNRNIILTDAP